MPVKKDIPEGCGECPGYILDVFDGSLWVTQAGLLTEKWEERGVWPTVEAAEKARVEFWKTQPK